MKKIIFIRTFLSFFPFCSKNEKIEKLHTYRPIFHNSILIRKMKKWQVLRAIFYFSIYLINSKTLKRYTLSDSFSFFILLKNGAEKWEVMNILTVKKRLANLVRRFTQGRRRCGGIWGGGGGLSFRDADVVPFTFDLDFLEGLSCRESTVDESGGKTVPYRPWKWRILERVRGRRRRRENWYGKRGW